jgi:aryl-alcohol dehydrogenase-like predicted oxidoreductase
LKLALGTVQFGLSYGVANAGGQISLEEGRRILRDARACDIGLLDTALAYGDSETRLGEIGVDGWRVVSKLPAVPDDCTDVAAWARESVLTSLQHLGVPSLYGLLLHRPDQLLTPVGERLYGALEGLKREGLVARIGISIYEPVELDTLAGRFAFDIVQAPFNLLDRRLIDSGWLARLKSLGTELHVRSVFLQGLLLMARSQRPSKFGRWQPLWTRWDSWLGETQLSPLQACLRYALGFPEIDAVIVGVDSAAQLAEIVRASEGPSLSVPPELATTDPSLLNPARWGALA